MNRLSECIAYINSGRARFGYSTWDEAQRFVNRRRLENGNRVKRKKATRAEKQRAFDRQRGLCPKFSPDCDGRLLIPAYRNEMDHKDPNREDFDHPTNLQLLCPACNRYKSSRPIGAQAKLTGRTFQELISGPEQS